MWYYRKILRISYKDHVSNDDVCAKIQQELGPHEDLLIIIKTRQTEEEVERHQQGMDRPGVRQVPEGSREQTIMEENGVKSSVVPQRPSR